MLDFSQSGVEVLIDEQILVIAVFGRARLTLAGHSASLASRVDIGKVRVLSIIIILNWLGGLLFRDLWQV